MATPPKVDLATMSPAGWWPGESQATGRRHVLAYVVATARGPLPGTPGDRVLQAAAVVAALLPPSL